MEATASTNAAGALRTRRNLLSTRLGALQQRYHEFAVVGEGVGHR